MGLVIHSCLVRDVTIIHQKGKIDAREKSIRMKYPELFFIMELSFFL